MYDEVRPIEWNVLELQDENAGLRRGDAFEEAKKWYDHAFAGAPSEVYPAPDRNAQPSEMELVSRSIDVSQESMRARLIDCGVQDYVDLAHEFLAQER